MFLISNKREVMEVLAGWGGAPAAVSVKEAGSGAGEF
ncbi:unnamed protein product (plasmid) [Mycetohabitans rhizoxinica HKI 454]|uniref:Uncharacterized protein n=1 Tax=Mycetohabitans rhizoxinica (strain DSM 19002 / CIP 109453 / HKI 454) TaxID=882378 RepID=E5AVB3_MYCRK|nr:unnamed protein product [Mycetohabitans rhizoxinica HKI 454]